MKKERKINFKYVSIVFILLTFLNIKLKAQCNQNLVLNPSFEQGTIPLNDNAFVTDGTQGFSRGWVNGWQDGCNKWAVAGDCGNKNDGTCDIYDTRTSINGVKIPSNSRTANTAERTGQNRYAGMYLQQMNCNGSKMIGESMIGNLSNSLKAGRYEFSVWVKLFDLNSNRLSSDYVKLEVKLLNAQNCQANKKSILVTPKITGTNGWTNIKMCFDLDLNDENAKYQALEIIKYDLSRSVTINNNTFNDDYIFIDDVSLKLSAPLQQFNLPTNLCENSKVYLGFPGDNTINTIQISNFEETMVYGAPISLTNIQNINGNYDISNLFPNRVKGTCYKVLIKQSLPGSCCPDILTSLPICFKDCESCEAELQPKKIACDKWLINNSSNDVNISCNKWSLDGIILYSNINNPILSLTPGNHIICFNYFGTNKWNPNKVCCGTKCININVPIPVVVNKTINYCDFITSSNKGIQFDPSTDVPQAGSYTIILGGAIIYNSFKGSLSPFLQSGNYTVIVYDEFGCLLKTINLNVVASSIVLKQCTKVKSIQCNQPYNLQGLFDEAFTDCNCSSLASHTSDGIEISDIADVSYELPLGSTNKKYRKTIRNSNTCEECILELTLNMVKMSKTIRINLAPNCDPCKPMNALAISNILALKAGGCGAGYSQYMVSKLPSTPFQKYFILGSSNYNFCPNVRYTFRPIGTNVSCCEPTLIFYCALNEPDHIDDAQDSIIWVNNDSLFTDDVQENMLPNMTNSIEPSNNINNSEIIIIPNPTSSIFKVQTSDSEKPNYDKVEIMDNNGKVIMVYNNPETSKEYNLSEYSKGIYIVRVKAGNNIQQLKLILQ